MIFLTVLGVAEICSLDQFQKGKQVKRYLSHQDQSSYKTFQQQFCFVRCRRQQLWAVEQRRCSRFTFVEKTSFWEVMDSFVLLAYLSLAASRILLQQLLAYLNFTLDSHNVFCFWLFFQVLCLLVFLFTEYLLISMNYGSSTSS